MKTLIAAGMLLTMTGCATNTDYRQPQPYKAEPIEMPELYYVDDYRACAARLREEGDYDGQQVFDICDYEAGVIKQQERQEVPVETGLGIMILSGLMFML